MLRVVSRGHKLGLDCVSGIIGLSRKEGLEIIPWGAAKKKGMCSPEAWAQSFPAD